MSAHVSAPPLENRRESAPRFNSQIPLEQLVARDTPRRQATQPPRFPTASMQRGYLGALWDRCVGWKGGLGPETGSYTIKRLWIPLEDGVKLAADLYRPLAECVGTILVRTPYGIGTLSATTHARVFAARGYQVLFSSCRGTAASEGEFDGARCEAADGQAVVAWMRKQDWYTGSFATLGQSYLGYVQWALLSKPPPDLRAAIINVAPHGFGNFSWETGAFNSDCILWADFQSRARSGSRVPPIFYPLTGARQLRPHLDAAPLRDGLEKYFGKDEPAWLLRVMAVPDLRDPFWKPVQHEGAFETAAKVPILLTTGWYDLIMPAVMEQYRGLAENGGPVALTVGPWTHYDAAGHKTVTETIDWLDAHLSRRSSGSSRASPVRIYVTGQDEWRQLPRWPPPTDPYELFLHPSKILTSAMPTALDDDGRKSEFRFDPADPTPTAGACLLFDLGKRDENTSLLHRPDVLVFTTEPLEQDVEVCGQASVELFHSSDHPHVDLLVVLCEVGRDGKRSRHISERYLRLPTDRQPGGPPLKLLLHDCAHLFRRGSRIGLLVAGGSHPRFLRNNGTGEDFLTGTGLRPARHSVGHSASAPSKLILPVTRDPDPESGHVG